MKKSIIIVTGAARGIGKACVDKLLSQDWQIIACDKDKNALKALESTFSGKKITCHVLDVTRPGEVKALFSECESRGTPLYGLVNNAGIYWGKPFLEYTPEQIDTLLATNLNGAIYLSQEFWRMASAKKCPGAIVNIGSVAGQAGSADVVYGTSKAALLGLTKMCAQHFAPHVRVNAVAPGLVETDMLQAVPQLVRAHYQEASLLKDPIAAADIAEAVAFLLSEASRHITGATLDINNGIYLR